MARDSLLWSEAGATSGTGFCAGTLAVLRTGLNEACLPSAPWKQSGRQRGPWTEMQGLGRPSSAPDGRAHSRHVSVPHEAGPGSRLPDAAAVAPARVELSIAHRCLRVYTPVCPYGQGVAGASACVWACTGDLAHSGSPRRRGGGGDRILGDQGTRRGMVTLAWAPEPSYGLAPRRLEAPVLGSLPEPLAGSFPTPKMAPCAQHPELSSQGTSDKAGKTMPLPSLPSWFSFWPRSTTRLVMRTSSVHGHGPPGRARASARPAAPARTAQGAA